MELLRAFDGFITHLAHERQCSPQTTTGYRRDFQQFLAWLDATLIDETSRGVGPRGRHRPNQLAHFTPERVRAWQAYLSVTRRLAPNAIRRKLCTLSSFAKFLVRQGAIDPRYNPMAQVVPPKQRKRVRVGLSLEAFRAVLALSLPPREAAIRALLAWTGIRRDEVLGLTVGACRLEATGQAVLLVRGKGDKERLVPVPTPAREALIDYVLRTGKMRPTELLFPARDGRRLHASVLNKMATRWGRLAGVAVPVFPHAFRHTYATGLASSGVKLHELQAWLGHESLATTAGYLHAASGADARSALDGWVQASSGYVAPPDPTTMTPAGPMLERGSA